MATEPGASPSPSAPGDSALARIPGVFLSPVRTFEAIARRPTWLPPVILGTVVSLAVAAVLMPRINYERLTRQAFERRGQTVPEDRFQSMVERQKRIGPVVGYVAAGLGPIAGSLLVAVVLWGSFKAFGWDTTYPQAFGVTAHAFLPGVLGSALLLILIPRQESVDPQALGDVLRSNLGFLVERDSSKFLHSLLGSLDLFAIWSLALFVIGLAAAAKLRRSQAAGIVVTLWALFVLGRAGMTALF